MHWRHCAFLRNHAINGPNTSNAHRSTGCSPRAIGIASPGNSAYTTNTADSTDSSYAAHSGNTTDSACASDTNARNPGRPARSPAHTFAALAHTIGAGYAGTANDAGCAKIARVPDFAAACAGNADRATSASSNQPGRARNTGLSEHDSPEHAEHCVTKQTHNNRAEHTSNASTCDFIHKFRRALVELRVGFSRQAAV